MESQNQQIGDNDEITSARIPINFDEFGKPLKELKKSESNDLVLVPQIVVNIIQNMKQHKLTKPYFISKMGEQNEYILLEFLSHLPKPLIPLEVSKVLLKIQEKFGAEHPYLCNSRFRHALHQCQSEDLAVAQFIFQFLQELCLAGSDSQLGYLRDCLSLGTVFARHIFGSESVLETATEVAARQRSQLLARIVSQFISEYRAIFEIESSLETIGDQDLPEHRKRHDNDDDECPEDIKAMKVAWEELSLDCPGPKEGSPGGCFRPLTPEIVNLRGLRPQSRLDFVKTFVNTNANNNNSLDYGESFVSGEKERCCGVRRTGRVCSRKRKERQESGSSDQDNKFSRSSSLESPLAGDQLQLKWRSSSLCPLYDDGCGSGRGEPGETAGPQVTGETLETGELGESGEPGETGDHVLHEVQESALHNNKKCEDVEKATGVNSRPRRKALNANRRNRKERCNSMKENDLSEKKVAEEETEDVTGEASWVSRALHHVMSVQTEPESLRMMSPANMTSWHSERHIEHNQHLTDHQSQLSPRRSKHKQISRQLSQVKRKIENLEYTFAEKTGYRPSQADMMTDPEMISLVTEQTRLKKEIKNIKENVEVKDNEIIKNAGNSKRNIDGIKASLSGIETKLEKNRQIKQRPFDLDLMTIEQIIDEKLDIQTLLLDFENIHGHPKTKDEKEAMKGLYERYRSLKMIMKRSNSARSRQISSDLVSIPEDCPLSLTLASPPHRIVVSVSSPARHDLDLPDLELASREQYENWHSLPRDGLEEIQRKVKEEKKQLKRHVKELEDSYKSKTGRKLHKEDRDPLETTFQLYKSTKAKLKLIDALLSKPSALP